MPDDDGRAGQRVHVGIAQRQRLDHTGHRHRVALVADPGEQAAQHAERDGQGEDEGGPGTGFAAGLDGAAELLDCFSYDVQTDAAA